MIKSDTTSDRTLAPVRRKENANLIDLHVVGFAILIVGCSAIAAFLLVEAIARLPAID